jgi:hypothetical protein
MRSYILGAGAILLAAHAMPTYADVIFSEDFSGGNPASSSDYTLVNAGTETTGGDYRIVNNPADPTFTNNYGSVDDHTTGNASGEMLFFDGATDASTRVYFRSATLVGGVQYTFSYWQEADNLSSVPDLEAFVNTTSLGSMQNTSTQTWAQFSANFTPATSGDYVFSILDDNTVLEDNDGAVDDIELVSVPEPAAAAILGISVVSATMLRTRRRRA